MSPKGYNVFLFFFKPVPTSECGTSFDTFHEEASKPGTFTRGHSTIVRFEIPNWRILDINIGVFCVFNDRENNERFSLKTVKLVLVSSVSKVTLLRCQELYTITRSHCNNYPWVLVTTFKKDNKHSRPSISCNFPLTLWTAQ